MHRLRHHSGAAGQSPSSPSGPGAPGGGSPGGDDAPAGGRRRRRVALLGLLIVALIAGGAFAATRPGRRGPSTEELTALAQRAVLTVADLPTGWTQDPPDDGDSERLRAQERALAECLGAPYDGRPDVARASFSTLGLSVSSEFNVAPTLDWAEAEFSTLLGGDAPGCYAKVLRVMLDTDRPAGTTFDIDVTRFDPSSLVPPALARTTAGLRARVTVRQSGLSVPMTFDSVLMRHDRLQGTVTFTAVGGQEFPADLRESLTGAVAARLLGHEPEQG